MDPISGLTIATAVAQFLEVAFKLTSKSVELYRHGSLIRHSQIREQAETLQHFNDIIKSALNDIDVAERKANARQ
jgi:hypothetical protein